MRLFFTEEADFGSFVDTLVLATRVVGPIAKRQKFVFGDVHSAEDLRLDYDTTLLPPKKVFFPPEDANLPALEKVLVEPIPRGWAWSRVTSRSSLPTRWQA